MDIDELARFSVCLINEPGRNDEYRRLRALSAGKFEALCTLRIRGKNREILPEELMSTNPIFSDWYSCDDIQRYHTTLSWVWDYVPRSWLAFYPSIFKIGPVKFSWLSRPGFQGRQLLIRLSRGSSLPGHTSSSVCVVLLADTWSFSRFSVTIHL